MQEFGFLQKNLHIVFAWPVICGLLGILMWSIALSELREERDAAENSTYKHAASLSKAYAEQLARSIEQLDQITLSIKYYWKATGGRVQLEDQLRYGLHPPADDYFVSVADRNGTLITSTLEIPKLQKPRNYANSTWFQAHKNGPSNDTIMVTPVNPEFVSRINKPVIHFTRRLDANDGSFDGVVFVTVEPHYLTTFYEGPNPGGGDFITVRLTAGPLLATKMGDASARTTTFYRSDPVFDRPSGVIEEPKEKFIDDQERIVAWNKLDKYPLLTLAGISKKNALAGYESLARRYRSFAAIGSVFLFLSAIAGMMLSARLAWRNHQADEIKKTYLLAVDAANEGFYMIRPLYDEADRIADFQIEDCNERGAALVGAIKERLVGRKISDLTASGSLQDEIAMFRRAMETGFYEEEMRVPPSSALKANWVYRRLVLSGAGLAMTVRDISESKAHEQALSIMANADALTALPNRHWLANYLPAAVKQAASNGTGLAILFIDLDDFKNINDTLGHAAGDELLKAAAKRLTTLTRASDHVARLGGDEFTIVLEHVRHMEDVSRVAKLAINALGEPFTLALSAGHRVQASIGISMFPQDGQDGETLLKHADIAMYSAKAAGKGRYHFYHSHLSDSLILRINREQALREAIERDEFVLHYQPRVDTFTGKLCSMEALVRWMHPKLGLIPPLEFIQMAEDTRLILDIGKMVIEKACAQLAQWKEQGLPLVPISINVSALQFSDGNVKSILASAMEKYAIDPTLIGVELTESCMIGQDEIVSERIDAVRALGVKLLVDDFGTGYSSLSQLQRLNVDVLKVDRAFTMSLCDGVEGKAFFKAIMSMANALDLCIVAEGVETLEQLRELQALSCDEIQGNFVSLPVAATEAASLILKRFLFPPSMQQDIAAAI
ncbi:MAG: hypothetical protein A3I66_24405 [Burkholderiales bacterium RIFCSPLOWO2_02_FULL_57_36]|nr:MAG: hypothetical protein A3I66_24405 [Burkholderiales bacterium RIFCSPLOWO2_02_FULL_57_36]